MEQEDNKSAKDDRAWFDALGSNTDSGQAARLRSVLREVELADAAQEETEHDWQRLQFALRREVPKLESKGRSSYNFYALAASVLILVGTVLIMMPMREAAMTAHQDSVSVMRGTSEQVILSSTSEQEAQQLEAELVHLGVKATRSGSADRIELHIPLSYPVKDEVRAALESRIIPVPEQGDLQIVFIQITK